MGGRAVVGVSIAVGLAGAAVVWWQMSGGSGAPSPDVALKPGVSITSASSGGRIAQNLEVDLYKQLRDGDAAQQQQAVQTLTDLVASQPYQIIEDIPKWLKPLTEARLHAQVLELTEKGIPLHAENSAAVSDQQRARAEALLALGEHERALAEAKSAFNVAAQKTADRTVVLLIEALKATLQATDPTIVERFERQQVAGVRLAEFVTPNVLDSISVDASVYASVIDGLSRAQSYPEFMARGNLLLIADRPAEAREAFRQAVVAPGTRGKELFAALEGIIRAERAESGSIGHANAMVEAMKFGAVASPALASVMDLSLEIEGLQSAGKAIPATSLPPGIEARSAKASPAQEAQVNLAGRMARPMAVVREAKPSDPALLAWLQQFDDGRAIPHEAKQKLAGLLKATDLEALSLFEFARAIYQATEDKHCSALVYAAAAGKGRAVLNREGTAGKGAAMLAALVEYRENYKDALSMELARFETLRMLYEDFVKWAPAADASIRRHLPSMQIGLASCHYTLSDPEAALAVLARVDRSLLNEGENTAATWVEGLSYQSLQQYAQAVELLHRVAESPKFAQTKLAMYHEIGGLISLERFDAAVARLEAFKSRYDDAEAVGQLQDHLDSRIAVSEFIAKHAAN